MIRSFQIVAALARRRSVRVAAIALLAAGALSGSLPLLEAPGYELGELGALLAVLAAPFVGIAAARLELGREAPSPAAAWAGAAGVVAALVAALLLGAVARAALGPCSAIGPAAWFLPLLAIPSAMLGAAVAVATGFLARGRAGRAGALFAAVALASLAGSLRAAYLGPAAFLFDPLLGGWPGPIYDEALVPDARVVLLRLAAAAEAVAVAATVEAFLRAERRGRRAALWPVLAAGIAAGAALAAGVALDRLDLSGSRAAVARALGGRRDAARCTLVYPVEKPPASVEALLSDCEFQQADVARALGIADPPHVTAYVYRSAAEKRRLVGAAGTEYAKPWLAEVHVVDAAPPHPILRHEIVHAVAARVARGPLGVPARALVLVNAGLVEGLAAALETPRGRWTVHEWSRAALDLGLLPDLRAILGPAGFWSEAPARAYPAAGSFLGHLLDTRGAAVVREAYRTGDVAGAAGAPLDALVAEWKAFLGRVGSPPGVAAARARLSRRSLFGRRCAREVATLEARAGAASGAGRAAEACALYGRAAALSGSAWDLAAAGDALARAGDLAGADAAYRDAAQTAGEDDAALRASVEASRADLAWRRGDVAAASAGWTAALAAQPERAEARLLEAKIAAAADPELGPAARDYLLGLGDPGVSLARAAEVRRPLAAYLLGRALEARGQAAAAARELGRALDGALPPLVAREAALLLGEARCASGATGAGERVLASLDAPDASAADRARAGEARRRCAFLARTR